METVETTVDLKEFFSSDSVNYEEFMEFRKQTFGSVAAWRELYRFVDSPEGAVDNSSTKKIKKGFFLIILGRTREALEVLKGVESREMGAYLASHGHTLLENYSEAEKAIQKGLKKATKSFLLKISLANVMRYKGELEEAFKILDQVEKQGAKRTEYYYQLGFTQEASGDYADAMANYEKALELDPTNSHALFRLAFNQDLRGDPDVAVDLYEELAELTPTYVNALMNLAIICEDGGEYERAIELYNRVLKVNPNHQRAKLFLKDATASLDMFYDEELERKADKKNQILKIPVTDFELSVRSRNCLNKMNIRTLGDLIKKTEAELLAYKNFGETSLMEIKQMLAQKGLRLGMAKEDEKIRPEMIEDKPILEPEDELVDEEVLQRPISDLDLSVRVRRCMERLYIFTIGDVITKTESELLSAKNFGQTSLSELKSKLGEFGLTLREEK
jgi:DNA-directed RNA polymerase subunit alpha